VGGFYPCPAVAGKCTKPLKNSNGHHKPCSDALSAHIPCIGKFNAHACVSYVLVV